MKDQNECEYHLGVHPIGAPFLPAGWLGISASHAQQLFPRETSVSVQDATCQLNYVHDGIRHNDHPSASNKAMYKGRLARVGAKR